VNNLLALNGVYNDIANVEGLFNECKQGQLMGFDGKTIIHPNQIEITNQVFSPSVQALQHAHDIVNTFSLQENQQSAVLNVNGKMVERLHLEQAQKLIALSQAISSQA